MLRKINLVKSHLGRLKISFNSYQQPSFPSLIISSSFSTHNNTPSQFNNNASQIRNENKMDVQVGEIINNFQVKSIKKVPEFCLEAYHLEHRESGSEMYHLGNDDKNNAFGILFRTPPVDSMGCSHILEHLALCGSAKYPTRDPFFQMRKRSLSTYMNAWTGSDFTLYPFSTQNETDFYNLLSVYLDAAFFPKLDKLDFMQEAHRLQISREHSEENSEIRLERQGVVLNEMKGAMSDPLHYFMQNINQELFPQGPYRHNSGGEPTQIPKLTHQVLKTWHDINYSPNNCWFLSYGNLDLRKHITHIHDSVFTKLNTRGGRTNATSIPNEKRFLAAKRKVTKGMKGMIDDASEGKIAISYLLNESGVDQYLTFALQVLSRMMFQGLNSPFYRDIIESGLASTLSPTIGYDTTTKDASFTISFEGIGNELEKIQEVESQIHKTLHRLGEEGFEPLLFDSALNSILMEFKLASANFGLQLISQMIPFTIYQADPLQIFNIDLFASRIRREYNQGLFQKLIKQYLISNNHSSTLIQIPDKEFLNNIQNNELNELRTISSNLTETEIEDIKINSKELNEFQSIPIKSDSLPTLQLSDISENVTFLDSMCETLSSGVNVHFFPSERTNGIIHFKIMSDIKDIPNKLKPWIPLFTEIFGMIGTKNYKYNIFNSLMLSVTDGLRGDVDVHLPYIERGHEESIIFSTSFVDWNTEKALSYLTELFANGDFNGDVQLITNSLRQMSLTKSNAITAEGLSYGLSYAKSGVLPMQNSLETLRSDVFICKLAAQLAQTTDPKSILAIVIHNLQLIFNYFFRRDKLKLAVHAPHKKFKGIKMQLELMFNQIKNENPKFREVERSGIEIELGSERYSKDIFKTGSNINHNIECVRIPNIRSGEFSKLGVLCHLISSSYLHQEIREKGGAYGGGANVDESGIWSFYSYRDSELEQTFEHFGRSVEWACDGKFSDLDIKEAKLLAFSKIDKPVDSSTEGMLKFIRGYHQAEWNQMRAGLLTATRHDLVTVAQDILLPALHAHRTSRVVMGGSILHGDFAHWNVLSPMQLIGVLDTHLQPTPNF